MAEEEFTGMYELLDALEAALKTADPAKRQALAKTSDAYHWAIGAQAPTLLYHLFMSIDAACRPDKQSIKAAWRHPPRGPRARGRQRLKLHHGAIGLHSPQRRFYSNSDILALLE